MKVFVELTERDIKIMRMIADSKCNKEISQALGVSTSRGKQIVTMLYAKCGINGDGRVGLARFAIRNGIVKA